ncbi:hydroxysqualene dehydroxylase HpnE [soil metagenome]
MKRKVAVIGAGWAGLAAAVRLVEGGVQVDLFEASRTAGGRARNVVMRGVAVDNGQHVLLGAYRRCLDLMRTVGVDERAWLRLPLRLDAPGRFKLQAARWLPSPWHLAAGLLFARGFSARDKWALAHFMRGLADPATAPAAGTTVSQWIAALPLRVRERMLEPLCVSALNTPPAEADAVVFATVLRDILSGSARDSDLLLPAGDLGSLLPEPALRYLGQRDAQLLLGISVDRLHPQGGGWLLDRNDDAPEQERTAYAAVVLATPPWRTLDLLASVGDARLDTARRQLAQLRYEPITTVYLRFTTQVPLLAPMTALVEDVERLEYGQFAFDRSRLGGPQGWIAVVISAARATLNVDPTALVTGCVRQLEHAVRAPLTLVDSRLICEKRATWLCVPNLQRPANQTPVDGLWLAGDYTQGPYPATLEQAVMSGEAAAAAVLASGINAPRYSR